MNTSFAINLTIEVCAADLQTVHTIQFIAEALIYLYCNSGIWDAAWPLWPIFHKPFLYVRISAGFRWSAGSEY
jgi:hypothetical protein